MRKMKIEELSSIISSMLESWYRKDLNGFFVLFSYLFQERVNKRLRARTMRKIVAKNRVKNVCSIPTIPTRITKICSKMQRGKNYYSIFSPNY